MAILCYTPLHFRGTLFFLLLTGVANNSAAGWSEEQVIGLDAKDLAIAQVELEAEREMAGSAPETDLALAVVLYRAGNFDQAENLLFEILGTSQDVRAMYHLGRIEHLRGNYSEAIVWYEQVSSQDDDFTAQAWADDALLSLLFEDTHTPGRSAPRSAFAFASVESQWVDGIIDPDDSAATEDADSALTTLLAASVPLWSADSFTELRLGGSYYQLEYDEYTAYNFAAANGYLELSNRIGTHSWVTRAGISHLWLDGADYLQQYDLHLSDTLPLTDRINASFGLRYISVESPTIQYEQYQGVIYEMEAELRSVSKFDWSLGYAFRNEDRQDQQLLYVNDAGTEFDGFRSYSRNGHELTAQVNWAWNERWEQHLLGSIRFVDYKDPDLSLDDSTEEVVSFARQATRLALRSELTRWITDKSWVTGRIEWLNENSNSDFYDFDGLTISVGLEHRF